MASTMQIDFATGADRRLALRKLQTVVDGAVAPETEILAQDNGSNQAEVVFPDGTASEQVLGVWKGMINRIEMADSGYVAGTMTLTGDVTPGSLQRVYSV